MGIPGKGARNRAAGIQTTQAINEAKCRVVVIVVAAFCSLLTPINGHRLTFRKTEEGDLELLACGGAQLGQMEVPRRAGGRVKIKEFHRPASSPSRLCEGDASHSNHTAIFSLHTTLRFKVKATDVGPPGQFWK